MIQPLFAAWANIYTAIHSWDTKTARRGLEKSWNEQKSNLLKFSRKRENFSKEVGDFEVNLSGERVD